MPNFKKSIIDNLWLSSFKNQLSSSSNNQNKLYEKFAIYHQNSHKSIQDLEQTKNHVTIDFIQFSDENYILDFLITANELPIYIPHFETIMLIDISHIESTPYNTIIFEQFSAPIKTIETTFTIMKRYVACNDNILSYNKYVAQSFKYTQRVPYIVGDKIFVPNKGYSKSSASWIGLHHVSSIQHRRKDKQTNLYGLFKTHIVVPYSQNFAQPYLERICNLYFAQKTMAMNMMNSFHKSLSVQQLSESNNVIIKMIKEIGVKRMKIEYSDYLNYFSHAKAQEILTKVIDVHNPYLDDILTFFEKN